MASVVMVTVLLHLLYLILLTLNLTSTVLLSQRLSPYATQPDIDNFVGSILNLRGPNLKTYNNGTEFKGFQCYCSRKPVQIFWCQCLSGIKYRDEQVSPSSSVHLDGIARKRRSYILSILFQIQ